MAVAGLVAAGCASGTGEPLAEIGLAGQATTVEVTNHNWQDVNVYAVRDGHRTRLGTVTSMRSETFELPAVAGMMGRIQLMASPIGSMQDHLTDPIMLRQGDQIQWNLENPLRLSNYTVGGE